MPSASLLGRLTVGAGTLTMTFAATAGLTVPAQATVHNEQLTVTHGERQASTRGRQLPALQVSTPKLSALHASAPRPKTAAPKATEPKATEPKATKPKTAAPKISSVIPAAGAQGWRITLNGRRFRHVTAVKFGGVGAAYTVSSATRIRATVPGGAKTGRITVTARAGKGRSATFTVTPPQTLEPGETLPPSDWLMSKDGHFTLAMQRNGNLVYDVTGTRQRLWSSGTAGNAGAYLTMLGNGNLVVYAASGTRTLWSSGTPNTPGARLTAQANGNLVVSKGSTATWGAGSHDSTLEPGESLQPGWFLSSGTGYKLTMRSTGNLAESGPGGTGWSTKTWGHPGATVTMRKTGNLAVHDGQTLWASKTAGHPGARLVDRRSGVLAVLSKGKTLWASKKATAAPLTLGKWAGTAGTAAAAQYYAYPYPHPPACTNGGACVADKWGFYRGQCTSWVAYRLNQRGGVSFTNSYGGKGTWGNAVSWARHARVLKMTVNGTPTAGSIAWYASTKAAKDGHVAYVEKVSSPTSIVMSEMNYDAGNGFWVHTITQSTGDWPTSFIHFAGQ
jgi:surface antigen